MNLLHLAPDIQEELLFLPRVTEGRDTIHEKLLRPIAAEVDWAKQRVAWLEVRAMARAAQ
jgi:predicted RecB family nuclease